MFRKVVSKIMQATVNSATRVQRPLSGKTPETVNWVKTKKIKGKNVSESGKFLPSKSSPKVKGQSADKNFSDKLNKYFEGGEKLTISHIHSTKVNQFDDHLKKSSCVEASKKSDGFEVRKNCMDHNNLLPPDSDLSNQFNKELVN